VPSTEIDSGHPLVSALREASAEVLGAECPLGVFPGATDASHLQLTAGIPTVAAFGPGFLPRAHSPNETASVAGIVQAAEIYAIAARRYLDPR
jgi:acetylornithine deacetylase/succinyl-diaminopimelate desuccinylase-like protein